jgi:hypothetical protein
MKRLKFRYKKQKGDTNTKKNKLYLPKRLEKLYSGVHDLMQAPAFDHDNQDPFLDSRLRN